MTAHEYTDEQVKKRWQELVAALKQEMTGTDYNALTEDFPSRTLKLGFVDPCTLGISRQQLMSGDLAYLAHAFYKRYQAGCPETEETKEK